MGDANGKEYAGILCIGDPHLCSRVPGFRRDDYPFVALGKLRWALRYAAEESLLPVLLGDLFHYPRDNANWLLVELMALFDGTALTVSGNHDCCENTLSQDDTLSVLYAAGKLRPIGSGPLDVWAGRLGGAPVAIGGTCWGQRLPKEIDRGAIDCPGRPAWVFWVAHHDVRFPGYEDAGRLSVAEIPGVDVLINGHIHRCLEDVSAGQTLWCNPGNISRVNRGDATRAHAPGVLRIDVTPRGWTKTRVPVPFEPFDAVFHPELTGGPEAGKPESAFIDGLATLQRFKTADGQGLREFLDKNLGRFDSRVAAEVNRLANEVMGHGRARQADGDGSNDDGPVDDGPVNDGTVNDRSDDRRPAEAV